MENRKCEQCNNGELIPKLGSLDQSGYTALPTLTWECPTCGFAEYEPAINVRWVVREEPKSLPARVLTVEVKKDG